MILLYVLDTLLNDLMYFCLPPHEVGDTHFTNGKTHLSITICLIEGSACI